ncbi:Transcription initiation factor TFIID subunit 5 [Hordeum vulgare]|nr:Transcription initiation factor TFIID subunit 5 [Hordeum vulgare]
MATSVKFLSLNVRFGNHTNAKMVPSFLACFPNLEALHIMSEKGDYEAGSARLNLNFWKLVKPTENIKSCIKLLEDSVEERMEKALSDSDRAEAESKDADAEDNNKKKSSEGGKQGGSLNKKLKKDKFVGPTRKNTKSETSMVSAAPRVKPELTLPPT